jgi:hypothetical protein
VRAPLTRAVFAVLALAAIGDGAAAAPGGAGEPLDAARARDRQQSTQLVSRALDGGTPNGPSTNAVISNDRRYSRIVAFESEASDLVRSDSNGVKDVFVVRRAKPFHNDGSRWRRGKTLLISRGRSGPADGPSFSPAVSGGFFDPPTCVAFLSAATNLVPGDTNGKVDAFVSRGPGRLPSRVSLPDGREATEDTTEVAVSADCSRIAFVTGGRLYVRLGKRVRRLPAGGTAADPSFSTGFRNDLVFTGPKGVYLSRSGTRHPKLVAPGGRNPAYSDIHRPPPFCKRRTLVFEKRKSGHWQVAARVQGHHTKILSRRRTRVGNADSRHPVIGNAGCYVTFESDASNLGLNATRRTGDYNGQADVFLYTAVRRITLVQSVRTKALPLAAGGRRPSMSFYANYIVFDSPAPLRDQFPRPPWLRRSLTASQYEDPMPPPQPPPREPIEKRQVFMRYLGPV